MANIILITPYKLDPLHPRLEKVCEALKSQGDEITLLKMGKDDQDLSRSGNYITLFITFWTVFFQSIKPIRSSDLVFIQHVFCLPMALIGRIFRKKVIYESIDNSIYVHFNHIAQQFGLMNVLKGMCTIGQSLERFWAKLLAHKILVGSLSLKEQFSDKADILYYCSPLEQMKGSNDIENPPALLYLGLFSDKRGAQEALELGYRYQMPLFIFGPVVNKKLMEQVGQAKKVYHFPKLAIDQLRKALEELVENFYLLGVSISNDHLEDYETQESNKDIDYLAAGVPILAGREQAATKSRVSQGCGLYYDDDDAMAKVIGVKAVRHEYSVSAGQYYYKNYTEAKFKEALLNAVKAVKAN